MLTRQRAPHWCPQNVTHRERGGTTSPLLSARTAALAENYIRAGKRRFAGKSFAVAQAETDRRSQRGKMIGGVATVTYLGVTNAVALFRLLAMSDQDEDIEVLALRHQISVLKRQVSPRKVRFALADRACQRRLGINPAPTRR